MVFRISFLSLFLFCGSVTGLFSGQAKPCASVVQHLQQGLGDKKHEIDIVDALYQSVYELKREYSLDTHPDEYDALSALEQLLIGQRQVKDVMNSFFLKHPSELREFIHEMYLQLRLRFMRKLIQAEMNVSEVEKMVTWIMELPESAQPKLTASEIEKINEQLMN